jgi:hypothetical protein
MGMFGGIGSEGTPVGKNIGECEGADVGVTVGVIEG